MTNSSHIDLWNRCLAIIKDNIPQEQYNAWFAPVTSLGFNDGQLTIDVPSSYFAEHLEEHYLKLMGATLRRVYGDNVQLFYHYNQIGGNPDTAVDVTGLNSSPAIHGKVAPANPFQTPVEAEFDSQLNPLYTFENYCGSECNKIARTIGQAIADDPKCKTFNPLFVFGPTGVGKTHLIQAIGIRIREKNPDARVLYVNSRLFESQFTVASRNGRINEFINFYQSIDVLIIDDIQDLINKDKTQNAFFFIFNHLHLNQKQIILSSDCCPSQMKGMPDRLLSRFKWGMTVELGRPDLNLRREVLAHKAKQDGIRLPQDVMDFIVANVTDSIRELEGVVVSLMAHATILNQEISLELARGVLSNAVRMSRRTVNFEMVAQSVASYFDIDPDDIFSKKRKREISDARQMVMYMAKKHAKMPLTAIGSRLQRTHATVLYACNAIEDRMAYDKKLQADVAAIEKTLL